jgi:hypothetical protein
MIWLLKGKIILRQMKDDFNLSLENLFFVLITIYNYNFFLNIEKSYIRIINTHLQSDCELNDYTHPRMG